MRAPRRGLKRSAAAAAAIDNDDDVDDKRMKEDATTNNGGGDDDDDDDGPLEVVSTLSNIGPISDMCVMVDADRNGQGQVVTCSNAFGDGSLRVVRNGVGIDEQASIALSGVRRVWALRDGVDDRFMVLSFTGVTRVLALADDELEQTNIGAFDCTQPTLCAANVGVDGRTLLHVTARGARLVRTSALNTVVAEWTAPANAPISCAAANVAGQLLVALAGGTLVLLSALNARIVELARATLEHEVACLDLAALTNDASSPSAVCGVGLWHDASLRLLALPSLQSLARAELGVGALPRSLVLATLAPGAAYALVGLGDGALVSLCIESSSTGALTLQVSYRDDKTVVEIFNDEVFVIVFFLFQGKKKTLLGTTAVSLTPFEMRGKRHVFAALDRPAVIFANDDASANRFFKCF